MLVSWFKKCKKVMLIVTAAILLGSLCSSFLFDDSVKADFSWDIQTIDSIYSSSKVSEISLDLDSNDHPHICFTFLVVNFTVGRNIGLGYACWNGSSWGIQTVDSEGDVGYDCSIALDSRDDVHISYLDKTHGDLKYAYWNGSSWDIQTVDSEGDVGYDCSIALDSRDNPRICYYDRTKTMPYGLKYAYLNRNISKWSIETIEEHYGWDISLSLNSKDQPCLTHFDYFRNESLKYIYWTKYGWMFNVPEYNTEINSGSGSSLALDSNDRPHIGYIDDTNRDLKYAYLNGDTWIVQTVDSDVGQGCSLSLDSIDRPHISYEGFVGLKTIRYAYWTGEIWDIITVDSGRFPSLDLDVDDIPHICYIDNDASMYAIPSMVISSPYVGETWHNGRAYNITWIVKGPDDFVRVELYKNGEYVTTISNTSNNVSYEWRVPESLETGNYEIKITSLLDNDIYASAHLTIEETAIEGIDLIMVVLVASLFVIIIIAFIVLRKRRNI
jgi:hypothetical protein